MNLLKILFGLILVGIVVSYPLLGTAGLMALGLPFSVVLIAGLLLLAGGLYLIVNGFAE